MILLLLSSIFSFYVQATILPAGYILRLHQRSISKPKTIKIEQRVVYAGYSFNETILFKAPDKLRVYVEKDGDAVLFIRDKEKCVAISSNARVNYTDLCSSDIKSNFYYSSIIPMTSFSGFLRSSGVKTNYRHFEIYKNGSDAEQSENKAPYDQKYPVLLLKDGNKPIYVLGLSRDDYKSAVSSLKRSGPNLTERLLKSLREKENQAWFETSSNNLLRVFGRDSIRKKKFELILTNYKKDSNNNFMPELIDFKIEGDHVLSYGLKNFETNSEYADEIFSVNSYIAKFNKTSEIDDLNENKKVLFNYLKEYR